MFEKELQIYNDEILMEIKSELAARYLGMEGRLKEQLNSDVQVQAAVKILSDKNIYNKLLNLN